MTYVGQPLKRFEDPQLVTGQGCFVDDLELPDMLHAAVLRSPHAHARLMAIDASAARNLPGVVAVLTGEEIATAVPSVPIPEEEKKLTPAHPVLARHTVYYVGQPVAVVVAHNRYLARDAIDLIQVDYTPLSPLVDPLEILRHDNPAIHEALGTNVTMRLHHGSGDLDAAFAHADTRVYQRYEVQRLAPLTLETRGVVATYDAVNDLLTVWNATQDPYYVRTKLASAFARPEHTLRVIAPEVGGGFGEKGSLFPEDVVVAYLALTLKRPIKWIASRREAMLTFHGRGHIVDVEAAVKSDGTMLGMRVRIVADLGALGLGSTSLVPTLSSHRICGPYHIPAMSVEVIGVVTNKPPTGAYRGAGGPEAAFCMERTVDLIARELQLDPADVRRRNFIAPDAFPYKTPTGLTYDSGNYAQGLEQALQLADYTEWREQARQREHQDAPLLGVGLATVVKASGGSGELRVESTRLTISPTGQITVSSGVSPHGQGLETTFAQIVADELGVDPAEVRVLHGDTALLPSGAGTAGSRSLAIGGSALYLALQKARQKLAAIAAHHLQCPAAQLVFEDHRLVSRHDAAQALSFAELAELAHSATDLPPDLPPGLEFSHTYTLPANPYGFGAHVVVVEVSRETGEVTILHYVAVHDCGRIINPLVVDGQMHGGIVQGIGQALTEGMVYTADGQPVTGSLLDYAVPKAIAVPSMILATMQTPSPTNPLGARGIGELPTVAAPVAVANAVLDALARVGVRHIDTPLTPDKIWRALAATKREGTS